MKIPYFNIGMLFLLLSYLAIPFTSIDYTVTGLYTYFSFALLVVYFTLFVLFKQWSIKLYYFDLIPLLFIVLWIYGHIRSFQLGNDFSMAVRNYAGSVCFILYYYFILITPPENKFVFWLKILGFSSVPLLLIYIYINGGVFVLGLKSMQNPFTQYVAIYSIIVFFELLKGFSLLRLLWLCVLLLLSAVLSLSKGLILGVCFCYFVLLLFGMHKSIRGLSLKIVLGVVLLILATNNPYLNILEIFSGKQSGNEIRYSQVDKILDDSQIMGNGLGAKIKGLNRVKKDIYAIKASKLQYGTELIYLDLFHKYGVLALILIGAYLYVLLKTIYLIWKFKSKKFVVALSCQLFLIIALGNPVLFAVENVTIYCFALFIIRDHRFLLKGSYVPQAIPKSNLSYSINQVKKI